MIWPLMPDLEPQTQPLPRAKSRKPRGLAVIPAYNEGGRIAPVVTRRCVADKLNAERAAAIVTEAAEQCARTALPEIAPVAKLDALLRDWPQERDLFFADEEGGEPAADAFCYADRPAALLIGPEGGFDEAERTTIRAHPATVAISLGPRILRGETAAIAGMAVWMAEAGDWLDAD